MRKVLELAISKVRGPFTSGRVTPAPTSGPGVSSTETVNYSAQRNAGNSTTPQGKANGASAWRGGAVGTIPGGTALGAPTSPGGKSLSAGKSGGAGKLHSGKGGLDTEGNDNTLGKMVKRQRAVRIRLGKVMD